MNWLFAGPLRPFVLLAGAASLLLNLALLMPAVYMVQVFDRVFASRSLETLAMLTVLAALALALAYCMDTVRARALAWAGRALDRRLSPAALSSTLHAAASPARRADDSLRDIGQLRAFLASSGIHALFDAPWFPLYVLVIAAMHPLLGLAAVSGAALLVALGVLTERLTRREAEAAQRTARTARRQAEALTRNAEAVIGMGMTSGVVAGWRTCHEAMLTAQATLGARSARLAALARVLRQGLQVAMLALGAWLVVDVNASPGIMVAATILLGRALQPAEQLISGWKGLVEARAAWRRLNQAATAGPAGEKLALPPPAGRLELERVVFGPSAGRPALIKGIGFRLEAGESLGVVGPSASGKTTLVRLILGVWTPQSGCVRLDGADIGRWDRGALGRHVGYLPQDVELFRGSVAENIARMGPVDAERVVEAAQLAHAHDMILRLPEGYDSAIGDAGAVLSGGQRQRIALARALYGNPRLVVLDEPNANLDAEGEAALVDALAELKARGVTVILVSHRQKVMAQLDKLAVLRDGALEAFGPATAILPRLAANARVFSRLSVVAPAIPAEAQA